jgi:hypothetical protein
LRLSPPSHKTILSDGAAHRLSGPAAVLRLPQQEQKARTRNRRRSVYQMDYLPRIWDNDFRATSRNRHKIFYLRGCRSRTSSNASLHQWTNGSDPLYHSARATRQLARQVPLTESQRSLVGVRWSFPDLDGAHAFPRMPREACVSRRANRPTGPDAAAALLTWGHRPERKIADSPNRLEILEVTGIDYCAYLSSG